ncbi:hypothetical protein BKA69DRAFT_1023992, partial [Paraphysoderma sedebokerense]
LTRSEVIHNLANRIIYSRFYKFLYITITCLAFVSIILSFQQTCPTPSFIALELFINFVLIIEVSIRLIAMKKQYWKSKTNILDIIVVAFCIVTVIFIWGSDCNGTDNSELIADSILLIIRNLIQLTRILNMLRRYLIHSRCCLCLLIVCTNPDGNSPFFYYCLSPPPQNPEPTDNPHIQHHI